MRELLDKGADPQEEEETRELTLDEAVDVGVLLLKQKRNDDADQVFVRILRVAPEYPRALHFAGIAAHLNGRGDDAIRLLEQSLDAQPDEADWHNNFGIVLQERGHLERAIASYERAVALNPEHADAFSNLGVLLRATGRPVEAEEAYKKAIRLNPNHIDAYRNLGVLLTGLKRSDEAVLCYCKIITLQPKHRDARRLLALAHCTLGEVEEATRIFREWHEEDPDDPVALHMLAACTGEEVPVRASDGFVVTTFDGFAASFESKLAKLSYRAPALVAGMLDDTGEPPGKQFDVLDAGCGTGLCGPLLAPWARTLIGVDLSPGMLQHAKEKSVYDQLYEVELTAYLLDNPTAFDLIVSADTLCYFGDLRAVVGAAAGSLRPGGRFVFTVEHAGDDSAMGYRIETHGRYSHARGYVEQVFTEAGFDVATGEAELRMEAGIPVRGLVVRATKRSQTADTRSSVSAA